MTAAAAAIAAAILQMQGHRPDAGGAIEVHARLLAGVIRAEAHDLDLDPFVIAALIARESRFDPHARGDAGDLGYMQIRRGGAIPASLAYLSDTALMHPRLNVRIGCHYLAAMIAACRGSVVEGLSRYHGGRCRTSEYARAILRAAAASQAPPEVATR